MVFQYKKRAILKKLPKRSRTSNKTDGGQVLIVAGGKHFLGAGILSALAATRCGAGYTHLMTDLVNYPWLEFPDFILHKMGQRDLKAFLNAVIAMGPGLGVSAGKMRLLKYLITHKASRVILDADALTMLGKLKIKKLPSTWILTPHEGELARLLKISSASLRKNRQHYLEMAHKKFGCIIFLKGVDSMIISDGKIVKTNFGPKALAKAGTGDVLLGIMAGLYAQNTGVLSALEVACLAGLIHGEAAKDWLRLGNDHLGLRPMDIIEQIPKTIKRLRNRYA